MRVSSTARRSNQSFLKEINPEYSLCDNHLGLNSLILNDKNITRTSLSIKVNLLSQVSEHQEVMLALNINGSRHSKG